VETTYTNACLSSCPLFVTVRVLIILVASEWSYCLYSGGSQTQEHLAVCMHAAISTAFRGVRELKVYRYHFKWVV